MTVLLLTAVLLTALHTISYAVFELKHNNAKGFVALLFMLLFSVFLFVRYST